MVFKGLILVIVWPLLLIMNFIRPKRWILITCKRRSSCNAPSHLVCYVILLTGYYRDAQRLNFEMHFRTQLPTRLNSTLAPSEAMKPLQIACFITPLTLLCTKQMTRIPYKKQAIIAVLRSLPMLSTIITNLSFLPCLDIILSL